MTSPPTPPPAPPTEATTAVTAADTSTAPTGPARRPTVGVMVATHTAERLELVRAAVASVQDQTRRPDELLVMVDNDEELAERVRAVVPGVRVAAMGVNSGVSAARTRGAELMTSDLVVFLDDDAVAEGPWLERLLAPMADPAVLGASGRSLAVFGARRPAWLPEEFLWTLGCSYRGMPTGPARVRNFYGGCAVVRRETFLAVGGFDPATGYHGDVIGGGEEADFCLRATAATGGEFAFEPAAVIRHHVPAPRLSWSYFVRRCHGEGVMKARLAARLPAGSLGPERAFALRLPLAVLRALATGRPARALGIVVGCLAVLSGLARGRWAGARARRAGTRAAG
ncbi:glycosyltransferase [Nocardioides sp. zg-579]|uniref:Glycosyltransferase n=1 Tax=Nocardioides marmotae TaxID=2663857 RepID=A0A6I3IZS0_9ACTN|nr:glycosyltransferase family 2 protein [Nocardioides marmotae]MCR6031010.1 glycosyltransferase [Gordonia jinghuaiqii]MTB94647.1 glycosyltransferase [Nocardioides marmotae]QKE01347.1 glycosyltransferase family 2 protein [Nocardioides marmotae]